MTNVKHDLRHDKDNVMLFCNQKVVGIVSFNQDWVELEGPDKGLPTKVGAWIVQNLKEGETVVGVRWLNFHSYNFQLTRFENSFRAQFTMPDKRTMTVIPGVIEINRYEPSVELLARYNECKVDGGTTWRKWFETKRHYDYCYHYCPQIVGVALSLIDNMLYEITKVPHRRVCNDLHALVIDDRKRVAGSPTDRSIPKHLTPFFDKSITFNGDAVTPIEVETFYRFLANHYYFGNHALGESVPPRVNSVDEELYNTFLTILGACLNGVDIGADPFAAYKLHLAAQAKQEQSPDTTE